MCQDEHGPTDAELFAANPRPRTRGDCLPGGCNEERPCPWISCKFHLAFVRIDHHGNPILQKRPLEELQFTCALDAAAEGGLTLQECGDAMELTRERIRQVVDGKIGKRFQSERKHEARRRAVKDLLATDETMSTPKW